MGSEGRVLTFVHVGQGRPATWAVGGEGSSEEVMLSQGQKEPGLGLRWIEARRDPEAAQLSEPWGPHLDTRMTFLHGPHRTGVQSVCLLKWESREFACWGMPMCPVPAWLLPHGWAFHGIPRSTGSVPTLPWGSLELHSSPVLSVDVATPSVSSC